MLTEKHLAVVRAALKYLDEEISPSGIDALTPYLDSRGAAANPSLTHVSEARNFFNSVELNYALVDSTGVTVESERLVPASSFDELNFQSDLSLLAAVLVPF